MLYAKEINLWKTGCCQGSRKLLREARGLVLNLQTLCKTIIGFGSELSLTGSTQRGRADETGSRLRAKLTGGTSRVHPLPAVCGIPG